LWEPKENTSQDSTQVSLECRLSSEATVSPPQYLSPPPPPPRFPPLLFFPCFTPLFIFLFFPPQRSLDTNCPRYGVLPFLPGFFSTPTPTGILSTPPFHSPRISPPIFSLFFLFSVCSHASFSPFIFASFCCLYDYSELMAP